MQRRSDHARVRIEACFFNKLLDLFGTSYIWEFQKNDLRLMVCLIKNKFYWFLKLQSQTFIEFAEIDERWINYCLFNCKYQLLASFSFFFCKVKKVNILFYRYHLHQPGKRSTSLLSLGPCKHLYKPLILDFYFIFFSMLLNLTNEI